MNPGKGARGGKGKKPHGLRSGANSPDNAQLQQPIEKSRRNGNSTITREVHFKGEAGGKVKTSVVPCL